MGVILSVILHIGIIFTVFRNHFRFQIQSEHLLELQVVEAKRFGAVHLRTLDDLSIFHNRHAIRVSAGVPEGNVWAGFGNGSDSGR